MDLSQEEFELIQSLLESQLTPFGFESSPLLIKWYNEQVDKKFKFKSIHEDSLAFCVTSTSEMFERGFLPFVFESGTCRDLRNALDESIGFYLKKMCQDLQNYQPIFYRDSDLEPGTRRPAFLAQTAAHVSGVAYYYHPSEIIQSAKREGIPLPWSEEDQQGRVYGVSIHHKYGGWFAIRGLIILQNVKYKSLQQTPPPDVVESIQLKVKLLNDFNFNNWKNWNYRDIIPVHPKMKYSQLQRKYFETEPKLRYDSLHDELKQSWLNLKEM